MLRLPGTGQAVKYTTIFGEDDDHTYNAPYYMVNGDGTVTDTITGLMWQQQDGGEMTIEDARTYCDTLTLAGHSDWKLPNIHELFSLQSMDRLNPSIDITVFTSTNAEYWWSSELQCNNTSNIWVTNAGGGQGSHPKTETISAGGTKHFNARAVRYSLPVDTIPHHFTDNGDSTIRDNLNGLIWEKYPTHDSLTWYQSLQYADSLKLTGHQDWRLPNIKELESFSIEYKTNPSSDTFFGSVILPMRYWSSTAQFHDIANAWFLDFQNYGLTSYDTRTMQYNLICVRGPMTSTPTGAENISLASVLAAYPNPFISTISIKNAVAMKQYQLSNSFGQIIYTGTNIATQDFSVLPGGLYLLKEIGTGRVTKLIKE